MFSSLPDCMHTHKARMAKVVKVGCIIYLGSASNWFEGPWLKDSAAVTKENCRGCAGAAANIVDIAKQSLEYQLQ